MNLITGPTVKDVAEDRGVQQEHVDALADEDVRSIILTGHDIKDLPDEQWDLILKKPEIVFARTTPQQKLEIVKHVQRNKCLVAVTGDGVNDAPALKQADIGVSMGNNASDVAREVSCFSRSSPHAASDCNGELGCMTPCRQPISSLWMTTSRRWSLRSKLVA